MAVQGENSLHFATALDNSGLQRGVVDAVGMIQGMRSQIARINPFLALSAAAATAFVAISRGAYKLSKEFQHAMKEVETISDATQRNFKKISAEVFKLSKISPDSPVKLANAYYQIVSSGYDGAKGLNLLEIATKSATAGVTDTMTAADGLTTVLNAFKIEAENSEHVADVFFQTVKLGKTNFEELASNMATVAPIAAANGISFEQISAAVATLTKQGTPTAQAMTQIRSAIIATNEVLEDGWSKSMSLQEAFQLIYKSANGNQSKLREMLGRVEAVNAVLGVSGINAKMAAEDLASYANVAGAMSKANERMLTSNTNKWELFGNNIKNKMHGIGETILESSSFIADGLNEMFEEAEDLTGQAVSASVEFENLRAELYASNTEFERKKEILTQLKNTYPEYLKSLDLTNFKESNWAKILKEVSSELDKINGKLQNKIELSGYREDLNDKQKELGKTNKSIADEKKIFHENFIKLQNWAKENKVEFEFTVADLKEGNYQKVAKSLSDAKSKFPVYFTETLRRMRQSARLLEDDTSIWKPSEQNNGGLFKQREQQLKKVAEATKTLREESERVRDFVDWGKMIDATKSTTELSEKLKEIVKTGSILNTKEAEELNSKIAKRKEIIAQLEAIGKITEKNKSELNKYSKSDNEEIKKAVEAQRYKLKKVGLKIEDDDATFADKLKAKEEEYANYVRVKKHLGEEYANQQYAQLLKDGEDYRAYLLKKLEDFKGHKKEEEAILETAEKNRFRGFGNDEVSAPLEAINSIPVKVELTPPDEQNINEISARITALNKKFNQARTNSERKAIANQIKAEQKKLDAMKGILSEEKSEHQKLYNSINDLTWQQLQTRRHQLADELKEIRKKLQKELAANIKNTAKINELKEKEKQTQEDLNAANEASGRKTQENIVKISGALRELSSIFGMFGDNDTSKILSQLAGVGDGIAKMVSGDIFGGAMQVVKSAVTVEIVSDTAKFEKQIKSLEKAISNLDYVISKSIGNDKVKSRIEGINEVKQLEIAANKAYEAEKRARKEVRALGIKVGDKGKGSGTDPAKLEEFKQKAEEARRKAKELQEQINEIWVGSDKETVINRIIEDLERADAKTKDFEKSFNEMIRNSLMQKFKREAIEGFVDDYFEKFARLADNEGETTHIIERKAEGIIDKAMKKRYPDMFKEKTTTKGDGVYDLTEDEIKELKGDYLEGMQNISKKYKMMQEVLKQIGAFDEAEKSKKGLVGEISSKITEETGTLLAGIARAKLAELKTISQNSILHTTALNQIVKNTSYNVLLKDVVAKLKNIEQALS